MKNKIRKYTLCMMMWVIVVAFCSGFLLQSATAQTSRTIYLKGAGGDFAQTWNNLFYVGDADTYADPTAWHLTYSGNINSVTSMQITFTNGIIFNWDTSMGFSTNGGGNNPCWVIVAPADWEIAYVNQGNNNESGSFVVTTDSGNPQFSVSGYHPGTGTRIIVPPTPTPTCPDFPCPEYSWGGLAALLICFVALGSFYIVKRRAI